MATAMATPTVVHLPEIVLGGFLIGLSTCVHMFTYQRAEDPQRGLMSIIMGAKKVNGHTAKFIMSLFISGIVLGLIVLPELFQPQAINMYQNSCYDLIRSGLSFGVGAAWSGGCFQRNSYHIPSYLRFVRFSRYSTQNIIAMVVFVTSAALSDLYRKTYHEMEQGITKTPLNLASFKVLNAPIVLTCVTFYFAIACSLIPFSWKVVQQKKIFRHIGSSWCGFTWGAGVVISGLIRPDVIRNCLPFWPYITWDPTLFLTIFFAIASFRCLQYYYQTKIVMITYDQTNTFNNTLQSSWKHVAGVPMGNIFTRGGLVNTSATTTAAAAAATATTQLNIEDPEETVKAIQIVILNGSTQQTQPLRVPTVVTGLGKAVISMSLPGVVSENNTTSTWNTKEQLKLWTFLLVGCALMGHGFGWAGIPFGAMFITAGYDFSQSILIEHRLPNTEGHLFYTFCTILGMSCSFYIGKLMCGFGRIDDAPKVSEVVMTTATGLLNVAEPLTHLAPDTSVAMYLQRAQDVHIIDVRKRQHMTRTYSYEGVAVATTCSKQQLNQLQLLNVRNVPFDAATR